MNFKCIMLRGEKQTQRATNCKESTDMTFWKWKYYGNRNRLTFQGLEVTEGTETKRNRGNF